jgi:hypothetical protein
MTGLHLPPDSSQEQQTNKTTDDQACASAVVVRDRQDQQFHPPKRELRQEGVNQRLLQSFEATSDTKES